jgi:hypothetical protein
MAAPARKRPKLFPPEEAARKDSAVHVSLSSDSLFKHPGTPQGPVSGKLRSRRSPNIRHGHKAHGRMIHRINSEGLRSAPSRQAAARQEPLYRLRLPVLSTPRSAKCAPQNARPWTADQATILSATPRRAQPRPASRCSNPREAGATPHCGHIPPPFLRCCVGECATSGSAAHPIAVRTSPSTRFDQSGGAVFVFAQKCWLKVVGSTF